jgi:hypothetical protein
MCQTSLRTAKDSADEPWNQRGCVECEAFEHKLEISFRFIFIHRNILNIQAVRHGTAISIHRGNETRAEY